MAGAVALPAQACGCGGAIRPPVEEVETTRETAVLQWDGACETIVMQLDVAADVDEYVEHVIVVEEVRVLGTYAGPLLVAAGVIVVAGSHAHQGEKSLSAWDDVGESGHTAG